MTAELIRDRTGALCALDDVRQEIRRSLGDCSDETLACNAAGRVHASQTIRVRSYIRGQRFIVYFLMSIPALAVALGAYSAGTDASAHGDPSTAFRWGALGFVSIVLLAIVLAQGVGRTVTVERVRGPIVGTSDAAFTGGQLAGRWIPVDGRWVGLPVVAHVVMCGMTRPLYLSGDLDVDRISPVTPVVPPIASPSPTLTKPTPTPFSTPTSTPTPTPALTISLDRLTGSVRSDAVFRGDDDVGRKAMWFVASVVSSVLSIWIFKALWRSRSDMAVVVFIWAAISVLAVPFSFLEILGARLVKRTTYTVRAPDASLTIALPGQSRSVDLHTLQAIDKTLMHNPADGYVTMRFTDVPECQIHGRCGDSVVNAIRRIRPDVVVSSHHIRGTN
jgi:hypothetical protein